MKASNPLPFLPNDVTYDVMHSPVGSLTIICSSTKLHAILWDNHLDDDHTKNIINQFKKSPENEIIIATKNQLTQYFQGERKTFDLPLAFNGTNFQIQAWQQLLAIPYASTISYAEQAEKIGGKNKARAVGMANGLNPIPIIVPCHRVIGSNGKLVGFAGGLEKKNYLLTLERNYG